MNNLTIEERATNFETMLHIQLVQKYIHLLIKEMLTRAENHDKTKLEPPEVKLFTEETPLLESLEYGTEDYEKSLNRLKPALDHHYARERHHPEHFSHGLEDMNLIDLNELFCDWLASSQRQNNGNLRKSIETSAKRFDMPPKLARIFENTIELFNL